MPLSKRTSAALVAVFGLVMAAVAFAGPANAAPYTDQARISVSTQTPLAGSSLTLRGSGFGANENVINTLDGTRLASARTDASGNFSVTITLPAGVTGAHTILSTGATSGRTATVSITIGAATTGAASGLANIGGGGLANIGGGGLARTGAAVIGIGALGGLLLVGGGAMVLAGRRRKVIA